MMFSRTALVTLGVVAALAVMLPVGLVSPAGAAATTPSSSSSSSAPSTPPNDPGNPGSPGDPDGSGGDGGDIPPPPPQEQIAKLEETCNGALAQLIKVPEQMVVAFDNAAGVTVAPVCNSGLGHQARIDASQAMPLHNAIANNPVLMAALQARGFHAEDVVGVVLIDDVATLYVHKGTSA